MSQLYEAGFIVELHEQLSEEIYQTLAYMIGQGTPGFEPSGFDHPFFHIPDFEEDWKEIINFLGTYDESLGVGRGSCMTEKQLVSRGLLHEDLFWNLWLDLLDWLYLLSPSRGIVGYSQNVFKEEEINFVWFGPGGINFVECEGDSKFEELKNQIIVVLADECREK